MPRPRPADGASRLRAFGPPTGPLPTVAVTLGGLSLRVPDWFGRVEPPPPVGEGVEPLAARAEWGDGDPPDRVAPGDPAWLILERSPAGRAWPTPPGRSRGSPPGLARAAPLGATLEEPPALGAMVRSVTGHCPFGTHPGSPGSAHVRRCDCDWRLRPTGWCRWRGARGVAGSPAGEFES